MKAQTFTYKGYTFKPIGNILGGWVYKSAQTTWSYKLAIEGYDHKDFYKVAKKHHASCDVYECDGKLYIPCTGAIIGVLPNTEIKTLDEYDRWYH